MGGGEVGRGRGSGGGSVWAEELGWIGGLRSLRCRCPVVV